MSTPRWILRLYTWVALPLYVVGYGLKGAGFGLQCWSEDRRDLLR